MVTPVPATDRHSQRQRFLFWAGLAGVYLVLAILATRPLITNLVSFTPRGSGSGDQCQFIWFFWWTKSALLQLHQSPFWTDLVYYPYGTGLAHHICLFTNLLAIVVSGATGIPINAPALYNIFVLFSFVVSGVASFALIRHIVHNDLAAFLGSLLFTFSPYFFFHLEHLNLLYIGWGLAAFCFTLRFLNSARAFDLIWAVVFAIVQLYSSLTNTMQIGCLLAFYLILSAREIISHPVRGRLLVRGLIGILLTVPLVVPLLISLRNAHSLWLLSWRDSIPNSAGLTEFVTPLHSMLQPAPGQAYVGWLLIVLAVAAVLYTQHKLRFRWAALAGIFLILALGPTLIFGERAYLDGWMPYRWLYAALPYFTLSRTPVRFVTLAQLCLSILAAMGIAALTDQIKRLAHQLVQRALLFAGGILVAASVFFLYVPDPVALSPMDVPAAYREISADTTIKVVCDLPISEKLQICNWYLYWQTMHGRREVNGYLAHHSRNSTALIDTIKTWQGFGPEEKAILLANGVDAVVIHQPDKECELIRLK